MSKKISRRDFLKGVGTMMGAVAASTATGVSDVSASGIRSGMTDANVNSRVMFTTHRRLMCTSHSRAYVYQSGAVEGMPHVGCRQG